MQSTFKKMIPLSQNRSNVHGQWEEMNASCLIKETWNEWADMENSLTYNNSVKVRKNAK